MVIASHIPGRLRLKGTGLSQSSWRQQLADDVAGLDSSVTVQIASHCPSLLIRYDPTRLAPARLIAWAESHALSQPVSRSRPSVGGSKTRVTPGWSQALIGRDANRAAKYGLLASTVVMLLALAGNTRLHAAAGGLNLAFLLVHLAHHRARLLK